MFGFAEFVFGCGFEALFLNCEDSLPTVEHFHESTDRGVALQGAVKGENLQIRAAIQGYQQLKEIYKPISCKFSPEVNLLRVILIQFILEFLS